ncbi:hypothetical protein [Planctomyces sp. SH-PL62]|uniref:hypothetical protein n=1 Tax=Planctomyces sp. SH-PL62 TaxID=1636152 RepID=UPI00078B25A6|nr:hypothetical protein [Planctomyces sp. SH-PL62]AMV39137.1 hypothetical protein VT85_16990 [Planctomyces sp. SH-PL62]
MIRLMKLLFLLGLAAMLLATFVFTVRVERLHDGRSVDRARREVNAWIGNRTAETRTIAPAGSNVGETVRQVVGQVSATEERAKADAHRQLEDEVRSWLDPQVPMSWRPPGHLLNELVVETRVTPEEKPYGTVYTANLETDFSAPRRERLVEAYRSHVVQQRIVKLGGVFGFLLVCLAATSGYIRADEATKGYYTNRLRLAAAAAVGASGVLIYQMLT